MRVTKPLTRDMAQGRDIIIYGAGTCGEIATACLKKWGNCRRIYYCDANERKGRGKEDAISPDELSRHADALVVLASLNYFHEMYHECRRQGISQCYDMERMLQEDIPARELSYQAQDVFANKARYIDVVNHALDEDGIFLGKVEVTVTEACSLRCRDCSYMIPYYEHPVNTKWELCCRDIDNLLDIVDRISELRLLGGEPFLHAELWRIIERYAGNEKIGMVDVHTNGTILPKGRNLQVLQNDKVIVHISDYQIAGNKVQELSGLLGENGIQYFVRRYDTWNRMGEMKKQDYSESALKNVWKNCTTRNCFVVKDGRFYRCSRSAHGTALGMIPDFAGDYLVLNQGLTKNDMKKYLSSLHPIQACGYCLGGGC